MNPSETCTQAIRNCCELPPGVRGLSGDIHGVEWGEFDQTYLDFLDEQISLEPRGPEWTERLRQRKRDYSALVDIQHLNCYLEADGLIWCFKISIDPPKVVHFEHYSYGTKPIG